MTAEPAEQGEDDFGGFIAAFTRLPAGIRAALIKQVNLLAGMSQKEKAYALKQLGKTRLELLKYGEVGLTVNDVLKQTGNIIVFTHDAGAGRDILAEIQDPNGPWRTER